MQHKVIVKAASLGELLTAEMAGELVPIELGIFFTKDTKQNHLVYVQSYFSSSGAWTLSCVFKERAVLKLFLQYLKGERCNNHEEIINEASKYEERALQIYF